MRRFTCPCLATLAVAIAVGPAFADSPSKSESKPAAKLIGWPYWRGPEQNGFAREKAAVTQWTESGENMMWRVPVGGRSTPILMNGRLFVICPVGTDTCVGERVICLDARDGRTLWENRFNAFLTDIVENRLGWTAVVGDPETGNVYAHLTGGEFCCFDRDGKILWKHSLSEEFGRFGGYGGRLHTPIVDEDRVIISIVYLLAGWDTGPRKAAHQYLAFDKKSGELLWSSIPGEAPLDTTYSVPVVTVINGKRLLIAGNADGNVYGMLARTGERVWQFKLAKRGLNSSVVTEGKYVYVTHSEENLKTTEMGSVVCIDGSLSGDITDKGQIWRVDGVTAGYASPALANGRLYVVDNSAEMHCFDAKTGKKFWTYRVGRVMKGSPTITMDGVIYIGEVNGRFSILKDEGDKCTSLDVKEFERPDKAIVEINGAPIVYGGHVYFQTRYDMYCLGSRDSAVTPEPAPPMAAEVPPQPDKPAVLQVVPAEVTLAPGAKATFATRVFDANGRAIEGAGTPNWSATKVAGACDEHGVFTAGDEHTYSSGVVTAEAGGLRGTARIRISPGLPINETFDKMAAGGQPPGWIGVDVKSQLVEKDGGIVLEKLAKSPSAPYMRMEAHSGPVLPAGYTVEVDVLAEPKRGRRLTLPEIGIINCRYEMTLIPGNELELSRWRMEPTAALKKSVAFDWGGDVWYTAKMRVDVAGGKARVRGKLWPRDKKEPDAWTVEMEDPCPNTEGSPGFAAYSIGTTVQKQGALVFYDNYRVYRDDSEKSGK